MNLTSTIPSYPYTQWSDDPDVVAFFTAYNLLSQKNLDTANGYQLPIFLNQSGALLDWAASSIYGVFRPSLSAGGARPVGPLNTWELNTEELNQSVQVNTSKSYIADDETYQRILQWNTFKGDGYQFSIRWLKRRIMRFISGEIFPDQTYQVSVSFGSGNQVNIVVRSTLVRLVAGYFFNGKPYNKGPIGFNEIRTESVTPTSSIALASALQAAITSGVLTLPFQYSYNVEVA